LGWAEKDQSLNVKIPEDQEGERDAHKPPKNQAGDLDSKKSLKKQKNTKKGRREEMGGLSKILQSPA